MSRHVMLDGEVTASTVIDGQVTSGTNINGECGVIQYITKGKTYKGGIEFTPSAEEQTIPTENCYMVSDIIINPIPSNYGLVEWNGTALTIT